MALIQQALFKVILRELWRKSWGYWRYLQLADPAKISKETTILRSLTKMVARIWAHSGKASKAAHEGPTSQSEWSLVMRFE